MWPQGKLSRCERCPQPGGGWGAPFPPSRWSGPRVTAPASSWRSMKNPRQPKEGQRAGERKWAPTPTLGCGHQVDSKGEERGLLTRASRSLRLPLPHFVAWSPPEARPLQAPSTEDPAQNQKGPGWSQGHSSRAIATAQETRPCHPVNKRHGGAPTPPRPPVGTDPRVAGSGHAEGAAAQPHPAGERRSF